MWLVFMVAIFTTSPIYLYRCTTLVRRIREQHPELVRLGGEAVLVPEWQEMLLRLLFVPRHTRGDGYAGIRRELTILRVMAAFSMICMIALLFTLPARI